MSLVPCICKLTIDTRPVTETHCNANHLARMCELNGATVSTDFALMGKRCPDKLLSIESHFHTLVGDIMVQATSNLRAGQFFCCVALVGICIDARPE